MKVVIMNKKILLFLSLLLIFTISSGCLNNVENSDPLNPLNKSIEQYEKNIQNIPSNKILLNVVNENYSLAAYTTEDYLERSDAICYATVKSIESSIWDTPDKKVPSSFKKYIETWGLHSDPHVAYDNEEVFDGYELYT